MSSVASLFLSEAFFAHGNYAGMGLVFFGGFIYSEMRRGVLPALFLAFLKGFFDGRKCLSYQGGKVLCLKELEDFMIICGEIICS